MFKRAFKSLWKNFPSAIFLHDLWATNGNIQICMKILSIHSSGSGSWLILLEFEELDWWVASSQARQWLYTWLVARFSSSLEGLRLKKGIILDNWSNKFPCYTRLWTQVSRGRQGEGATNTEVWHTISQDLQSMHMLALTKILWYPLDVLPR